MSLLSRKLKNIYNLTLTSKFINLFVDGYYYIKELNYISEVFYSKEFKYILKKYLKIDIEKDWIGRLYGVINPEIDINGKLDYNNVIIELDGENTNNNEYIKAWTYKQMCLIADLFKIHRLYDFINIEFKHVGPETMDNYLLIFDIYSRQKFAKTLKSFLKQSFFYIILICIFYNVYF